MRIIFENHIKEKGFTLVEMIVALTIILLFAGTSFFVYKNISRDKTFETDIELFNSILNKARERAIARDISPANLANVDCTNFVGYNIVLDSNDSTAHEQIVCGPTPADIIDINTYTFQNINLTNFGSNLNISFTYPRGELSPTINSPIIIQNSTASRCVNVTINSIGPINFGDEYDC